jgi:flagellin
MTMSVVNTNVKSLYAQNSLVVNNRKLSDTMQQLSTGKRINGAKDDAAGLAIASKMTAQIRGLNQAVRNANDGISLIQTAEGALTEVTNMLTRMRELAVQSANDTNTSTDRTALNQEFTQLRAEINRVAGNTEFNSMKILDGSFVGNTTNGLFKFQVGANANQTIDVTIGNFGTTGGSGTALLAGIDSSEITDLAKSNLSVTALDAAIGAVSTGRASMGAIINRLTYAADNLMTTSTNVQESRSRIEDTDYAKATTELARSQIIQQAATAMLAQANQQPQTVLSLLQ